MILTCPNCEARYEVANHLIPTEGRNVQCASCEDIWFFRPGAAVLGRSEPEEPRLEDLSDAEAESVVLTPEDAALSGHIDADEITEEEAEEEDSIDPALLGDLDDEEEDAEVLDAEDADEVSEDDAKDEVPDTAPIFANPAAPTSGEVEEPVADYVTDDEDVVVAPVVAIQPDHRRATPVKADEAPEPTPAPEAERTDASEATNFRAFGDGMRLVGAIVVAALLISQYHEAIARSVPALAGFAEGTHEVVLSLRLFVQERLGELFGGGQG
ncbi:zinc-ribbon domain-containing protein [Paracoccaceae bacterium GXU_MW_L88]